MNDQGLTNEEYEELERIKKKQKKELSEREKARLEELKNKKKVRNDAISILRGISIRMPLLIYGADISYEEEITLDLFVEKVDDSSWNEFMPAGVTKEMFSEFRKYYDEDIFIAAGRRIRNIAREADTLNPTERVKKIASLFSNFKNPDKETVLTPWRVVNMHMSDCLGGYDFYDEKHENTLEEPRFVDQGQVTADTFANTSAQILEINSKTGLYPLYVAYSLYRTKCKEYQNDELTLEVQREIWNDTIKNNVFVICKTPMAKQITQRTLTGYTNVKINAHYFDDLINQMKNKSQQFIEKVLKPSYWKKEGERMKFDAVVGNPPYQEEGESTRKAPIYHLFYDGAFAISDIVSLISPARFLFDAGQTPKVWNSKMLEDKHFKVVKYFSNSKDVFESVEIKGGIVITLRNKNEDYGVINTFTKYQNINTVLQKVNQIHKNESSFISSIVASRGNYRFSNAFFIDYPNANNKLGKGTGNMIASNAVKNLPEVFLDEPQDTDEYIRILARENNQRVYKYILKKYVIENDYLNFFNVAITEGNGTGEFGETLSTPVVIEPNEGATDTFISIGSFENLNEAEALLKYIKTKFARAMLSVKKATQHTSKNVWVFVPIQDFTSNSDIDWSKSISEIDKQLYAKYGLSEDEIAFIEEKIKPME